MVELNRVTVDQVKSECDELRNQLIKKFAEEEDVERHMREDPTVQEMFIAGEWLDKKLSLMEISHELRYSIRGGFGQMCAHIDPYKAAADAYNAAVSGNYIKAGPELADKLVNEYLKTPPLTAEIIADMSAALEETPIERTDDKNSPLEGFNIWAGYSRQWRFTIIEKNGFVDGTAFKNNNIFRFTPEMRTVAKKKLNSIGKA